MIDAMTPPQPFHCLLDPRKATFISITTVDPEITKIIAEQNIGSPVFLGFAQIVNEMSRTVMQRTRTPEEPAALPSIDTIPSLLEAFGVVIRALRKLRSHTSDIDKPIIFM
jgi:hypothetical protein